jgi:hypothetical protein
MTDEQIERLYDEYSLKKVFDAVAFARALLYAGNPARPMEPTEAMLNAARDWSVKKYGQGIGSDAAIGCWQAMLAAAPAQSPALIGWWDSAEASGFRWKEGIVRGDLSDGTPIYANSAAPAQSGEPVAWAAVYFGGKRDGDIYNTCKTKEQVDAYIGQVHQSDDSITLTARPIAFADAAPQPSPTAVVLDDERAAFLTWWCADVPEYMREKWKESVDECLRNNNATDKLVGAWEGFQYALTLTRSASPQPVEPVEIHKLWASGGCTGYSDYLMTDFSIRCLEVSKIQRGQTFPPNDGSFETVSRDNPYAATLVKLLENQSKLKAIAQPVEQTRALTDQMLEKLYWTAMDNAADILRYMEEARELLSAQGRA